MACWRSFLISYIVWGVLQLLPLSHVSLHVPSHGAFKGPLSFISKLILPFRLARGSS